MSPPRDLTEGSITRAIAHLGVPLIATSLLQSAFNLIDMFFVGRLGPAALAAVTLSGIVIALLITAAIGISIGTLALVARYWGARRYREAALVVGQSFHLSLLLSILFGAGGWFLARPLLGFLGGSGEVLELAVTYFRIISAGAWTIFIFVTFSSALKGSGDAWTPLKVMALGVVVNCLLDPLLIFGWGPIPALGVPGSALATVLSRLVTVVVIIYRTRPQRSHLDLSGAFGRISFSLLGRILRIGFFSSVEMLLRSVAMIALLRFVSVYGTAALAAYGIGTRLRAVVLMPGIGLGYSSGILVGQNLGAGQPKRAHRTAWATWGIYQAVIIPLIAGFFIFAREVVGLFSQDPEVLRVGAVFIRYLAVSFFFLALILVFGKSLNGAGDTAGPMVITGFALLVMVGFLLWPGSAGLGLEGIWKAILGATALNGLLMAWWFQRGRWRRPAAGALYPEAVLSSPEEPQV
ncbi:MAG: MATE family efflux transporter [Candidatus Erginobacter occultus]|nr:MATE family efflux transporter [Candidatus Erginobacter occultus]